MIRRREPRFYGGQLKDIVRLLFSNKVAQGKNIELFEKRISQYAGVKFAAATPSGRLAMVFLLEAFGLERGDEIIISSYTLKDLLFLIEAKGFVPKLVDIEEDSFNINPDLLEEQISPRTKVIIATHLFGLPCNLEKILKVARKYNLKVVEDCAHALGASYKGKRVGGLADAGFFSFETLKPINTFGGGMVTTNNPDIHQKIKQALKEYPCKSGHILRKISFSYFEHFIIKSPLYPFLAKLLAGKKTAEILSKFYLSAHKTARAKKTQFTNLQAFMALRQMESLEKRNKQREVIAGQLAQQLPEGVFLQSGNSFSERVFYFFVVKVGHKVNIEKLRAELIQKGIDSGIKAEITDNCASLLRQSQDYPVVTQVYSRALQLPLYDKLSLKDADKVAKALKTVIN